MCSQTETTLLRPDGSSCDTKTAADCCKAGQRVATWGKCGPACAPPRYFDVATGACADCQGNSVPIYDNDPAISSAGHCQDCPPNLTRSLTPPPQTASQMAMLARPTAGGQCVPCPPGQIIWNLNKPKAAKPPVSAARTPSTQRAAPPPPQTNAPPDLRAAPPGTPPAPHGPAFAANPAGPIFAPEAGKCVPCPTNWIPVYDSDPTKSSFGHCEECPPGTTTAMAIPASSMVGAAAFVPQCRPLNCPGGRYDPKDPHTCPQVIKAVPTPPPIGSPCPPGTRLIGGNCMSPQRPQPPRQSVPPASRCPPGMVPNPRGAGCVAVAAPQPVAPPNQSRPVIIAPPPKILQPQPPPRIQ
jgi:hypothetical protein